MEEITWPDHLRLLSPEMTEVTLQGSEQREKMWAVAKLAGSARAEHSVTSLEASGKNPAIAGFSQQEKKHRQKHAPGTRGT